MNGFIKVPKFFYSLSEPVEYIFVAIDKIISFEEATYKPDPDRPDEGDSDRIYTALDLPLKGRVSVDMKQNDLYLLIMRSRPQIQRDD